MGYGDEWDGCGPGIEKEQGSRGSTFTLGRAEELLSKAQPWERKREGEGEKRSTLYPFFSRPHVYPKSKEREEEPPVFAAPVVRAVYPYWSRKVSRLGKPLLRRFAKPTR